MTTVISPLAVSSRVDQRAYGGLPDRAYTSQSNPVGTTKNPTRLHSGARAMHPKLNSTPWSTTYAVKRMPMSKSKSKRMPYG